MRRLSAYRVFVTQRSEYHVRGLVCCGVRSRRTGSYLEDHWALSRPLATAFTDADGHMCSVSIPGVGEPLCFEVEGELLQTTPVLSIEEREQVHIPVIPVAMMTGSARETY